MRPASCLAFLLAWTACGAAGNAKAQSPACTPATDEEVTAELVVARAGCARCHALPEPGAARGAPIPGPSLTNAASWFTGDSLEAFLRSHHGGDAARNLAAWVRSLGPVPELKAVSIAAQDLDRGERLFASLACRACHAVERLESLAARTDHAHVTAFLADPAEHRPGIAHVRLTRGESDAIAAWLLRAQQTKPATPVAGFAYECFEIRVKGESQPEIDGVAAAARGIVRRMDVKVRTREDHFALRFRATLEVPATGEWTFFTDSDDNSWLWIDEQLVVVNDGPLGEKQGALHLEAGPHALRVLYCEVKGEQMLEVQWRGPAVAKQVIPAERATATVATLVPPQQPAAADTDSVQRGRLLASERRCDACHAFKDSGSAPAPPPAAAAFDTLGPGQCPHARGAAAIAAAASASLQRAHEPRADLAAAMLRDGCLSCHVRDGRGGLPPVVRQGLAEVEDLGDEGRLPPDLTNVGRRLRPAWIEKVVGAGHAVRPYLRVRMPAQPERRAKSYAAWFAAVDAADVKDDEPPFSVDAVQLGRRLAGTSGRNCVTCHPFDGRKALGPQGMDLAIQHERLRPAWFGDWMLHAATLRPGTRMPSFWLRGDDADRREVDALRTWLSFGSTAPLPEGLVASPDQFALEPGQRPRLHGAFLKGLSARCLAVGTPERTHYAYDLAHARLAWLWRGAFLEAEGTWKGRAGKLLVPKGQDWVVLEDLEICGGAPRRMLGQRMTPDGYPVFRVAAGEVEFEDEMRPRIAERGSEIVRTLRCVRGLLEIGLPPPSEKVQLSVAGGKGRQRCETGQTLEVVYRW